MKRLALIGVAGLMAFVLSCGFALQGFVILDTSLSPGQATTARFTVRPLAPGAGQNVQFFLIGRNDTTLKVGRGTWGTNGTFGGPTRLAVKGALAQALSDSDDCNSGGLDFSAVHPMFTWKGFATKTAVGGNVNKTATVDIRLKAAATVDDAFVAGVMAVTGSWTDTGNGVPDGADTFVCTGNATTSVYIKAS
jgi:hypothetical protein